MQRIRYEIMRNVKFYSTVFFTVTRTSSSRTKWWAGKCEVIDMVEFGYPLSGMGLSSYLTLLIPRRTKDGLFDMVREKMGGVC